MSDNETLQVYAEQAEKYASLTDQANDSDPILSAFLDMVIPGGHILDLGCGPGASAAKMARSGFQVTATDAVAEMIELAKQHKGVQAHVATFDQIEGQDIYDGVWANFSLLHAAKADMPRHLAALAKAVKAGGIFHIALKTGSGEKRDTIGRNYSYYSQGELTGLLNDAGFDVTNSFTGEGVGLEGSVAQWVALHATNAHSL